MSDGPEIGTIELDLEEVQTGEAGFEILRELIKQNRSGLKELAKR